MELIYDLSKDEDRILWMQSASKEGRGIKDQPALVGSLDFWEAIQSGKIPLHSEEGVITKVFWSGHGDFAEFSMKSASGLEKSLERYGEISKYKEGNAIRIEYVVLPLNKTDLPELDEILGTDTEVVLRIWLQL